MYRGKHHPLASFGHYYNLAQFNFTPYKVTELNVLCNRTPEIKVNYYCNLTFNWYDPNSVRQNKIVSGHCNTGWSWDGHSRHSASLDGTNPVVGYKACLLDDDTAFHVAIPNFWHPANFSLDMAHHYRDDE
ncbi:hypothetical protein N0V88_001827 [Collariella sp. IMI 366227]|nr:hypothetical protein N0V88_001827 [Collariella sp. IMI 366227]